MNRDISSKGEGHILHVVITNRARHKTSVLLPVNGVLWCHTSKEGSELKHVMEYAYFLMIQEQPARCDWLFYLV